jgi:hypothetical protein
VLLFCLRLQKTCEQGFGLAMRLRPLFAQLRFELIRAMCITTLLAKLAVASLEKLALRPLFFVA